MNNVKHLVSFWLMLIAAISCRLPNDPFNRPKITPTIANNDGTGFRNGERVEVVNMVCVAADEQFELENYYDDKEYRLQICLLYPKRCK